jgi:hypothetical protein
MAKLKAMINKISYIVGKERSVDIGKHWQTLVNYS